MFLGERKMIEKKDMLNLMKLMADYLKTLGLSEEDILGAVSVAKLDAIRNGSYCEDSSKKSK